MTTGPEPRQQKLAGLPRVMPLEAPASWLSRAALSQGVRLAQLQAYLGLPKTCDVDQTLAQPGSMPALSACGLDQPFRAAARIFNALRTVDPTGQRFLLPTVSGRSRYRFCPRCLAAPVTPFFGVHCRFSTWRFCPDHECLLEDACPHCKAQVFLPVPMLSAGLHREGIAYLSRCQSCGKSLAAGQAIDLASLELTEWELAFLRNGRATLSALYHGRLVTSDRGKRPLRELERLAQLGVLPFRGGWLEADAIQDRLQRLARPDAS